MSGLIREKEDYGAGGRILKSFMKLTLGDFLQEGTASVGE
jgi:hypothetical protein